MTYDRQRSISDIAFLLNTSSPPSPPSPYSSPSPSICSCSLLVALVPLRFLLFVPFYCCFMCCCSIPPAAASSGWRGGRRQHSRFQTKEACPTPSRCVLLAWNVKHLRTLLTVCLLCRPLDRDHPHDSMPRESVALASHSPYYLQILPGLLPVAKEMMGRAGGGLFMPLTNNRENRTTDPTTPSC